MDQTALPNSSTSSSPQADPIKALQSKLNNLQNKVDFDEKKIISDLNQNQTPQNSLDNFAPKIQNTPQTKSSASSTQTPGDDQTRSKPNKERQEQVIGSPSPERVPVKEVQAEFEAPAELEQWMEKKPDPQTITLPKPVEDDYGEILVQATQIPKPKITLPIDEEELEKGFHQKIANSIRWLAEWCRRNILLYPGRVFYKDKKDKEKPTT
jgi:hypothetical protein